MEKSTISLLAIVLVLMFSFSTVYAEIAKEYTSTNELVRANYDQRGFSYDSAVSFVRNIAQFAPISDKMLLHLQNGRGDLIAQNAAPLTYTFTPNPIMSLCPRHVAGDREFAGHGPDVYANVLLYLRNDQELWVQIYLKAAETTRDWTTALSTWTFGVWNAPIGYRIVGFYPNSPSITRYRDYNHQLDIPPISGSSLVSRFEIMGDTGGNDIGNCTRDDVYMNVYFNAIQVQYVRR